MNRITAHFLASRGASWTRRVCATLATSVALLALAACGGSDDDVDRGPTTIELQAKLNSLYWDARASRLYLTDDDAGVNAIKTWDGDKGFSVVYPLPAMAADQRATLGQLTRGADGNLYATRFGFGSYGTVVVVPPTGSSFNLMGLDGARRRIGITPTADGKLIDGWFRGGGSGPSGVISELTLGAAGLAGVLPGGAWAAGGSPSRSPPGAWRPSWWRRRSRRRAAASSSAHSPSGSDASARRRPAWPNVPGRRASWPAAASTAT